MRAMTRLTTGALALALAMTATVAHAQGGDDERARLHFEAGRSHFDQGRYEQALTEFEESYALSGRAALLFNLGTTLERLARWEEAADRFERFLAATPEYDRRADLESRIANLRRRAADSAGEGEAEGEAEVEPAPSGPSDLAFVGAGVLVGSAAALIGAIVLSVLALEEENAVRDGCFATQSCTPDDVAGIDDLAVAADVTGTASLGLAVLGAALIGIAHAGIGDEEAAEEATLTPMAGPTYAGLSVRGRFQ